MDLINREVTEAMEKANQQNSQKSTGPKTAQGKLNSRGNGFRHGLFGRELCPWAEELDEDAADYQRFGRRYRDAFQVRDEVEALLVADMARTQWRLERLLRAETACLAWQRRRFANEHRRKVAGEGVGMRAGFELILSQQAGYGALPESEGKYELILFLLRTARTEVEAEGYTETGAQCLRVLYGPQPGLAKQAFLINDFKALQPDPERREAVQEYLRQQFLDKLKEEEGNFQTLRDCLREERGKLFEIERDSQLMLSEKAVKIVAGEENRLRHYLQQLFKQLSAWRQRPVQEGPAPAPNGSVPPQSREDSGQPVCGGPPPAGPGEGCAPEPVGGSGPQANQPSENVGSTTAGGESTAPGGQHYSNSAEPGPNAAVGVRLAAPSCTPGRRSRTHVPLTSRFCTGGRCGNRVRQTVPFRALGRRGNRVPQARHRQSPIPMTPGHQQQRGGRHSASKHAAGRARAPGG